MNRTTLILKGKKNKRLHISLSVEETEKFLKFIDENDIYGNDNYTFLNIKDEFPFITKGQ